LKKLILKMQMPSLAILRVNWLLVILMQELNALVRLGKATKEVMDPFDL
jgi:hypothetical protein